MIRLKEVRESTLEQAIYEAKVEEALAKWETEIPLETENNNGNPQKIDKGDGGK